MIIELNTAMKGVPEVEVMFYSGDLAANRKSFSVVYDRYSPALYGVIRRFISESEESERVLHVSFQRISTEFHTFDPAHQKFFTWMLKIVLQEVSAATGQASGTLTLTLMDKQKSFPHAKAS